MNKEQIEHEDLHPTLEQVSTSMVDGLAQLATYFGFSRVLGQLYAVLILNPEPMSLDDMTEALNISKASASTNMRTLENFGMVRQVWTKQQIGRRKYYEPVTDIWRIISNLLSQREMQDIERAIEVMQRNMLLLSESNEGMAAEDRAVAELYHDRIEEVLAGFEFAQLAIGTILQQLATMPRDED